MVMKKPFNDLQNVTITTDAFEMSIYEKYSGVIGILMKQANDETGDVDEMHLFISQEYAKLVVLAINSVMDYTGKH
jgi:hypothetical protein